MFTRLRKILFASGKTMPTRAAAEQGARLSAQAEPLTDRVSDKTRGNAFLAAGKLEEAAACYRQAIITKPDDADTYINLGFVLAEQKRYADAETYLKQAIALDAGLPDALYILGTISREQGNLSAAIENFSKVLELKPDFEIVYRDLCHVLFQSGHVDRARETIMKGIALNPEFADFHYYLGNIYTHCHDTARAIACFSKVLLIQPDYAEVHNNLGLALLAQGKLDEAIESYRRALSLRPDFHDAHSNLLFAMSFHANCSPAEYFAQARQYGKSVMAQAKPYARWRATAAEDAGCGTHPLRVGFVSGDIRMHPVGFFLESVLRHLNPARIELVAYPTTAQEDELTARLKPRFHSWNPIVGLSDEAAARQIYGDGIHILIDLAGHTAHNRLPMFAWKPAPVQVSWLGYWASTGVPGIDYLLGDPASAATDNRHFTETVWPLPDTRLCFTPPASGATFACTPLPAVRNGHITFGSFQNTTKITDATLTLWGRIFKALPQARLRLQSKQMTQASAREDLRQRLARVGIVPERVAIEGLAPREQYLAAHAEVDIILDTFPFPGGTTTCESLWMGVPTLTLTPAGDTLLGRQGAGMLRCAGLEDWIAIDEDDYVAKALAHAGNIEHLAHLRSILREQVLSSPLFDAQLFARHLENALCSMWKERGVRHGVI